MADPLGIEVADLTVAYRNGHRALAQASFTVPQGSVTALVGVNGAGKSTLFKALMDLLPHATGQVRILGLTVRQALSRNLVAYVPQAEEVDWTFPVLVRDVGHVALGPEMRRGVSDLDGRGDVAGGVVVMRHGENARAVIARVKVSSVADRVPA